jgi:hypothetical protein
MGILMKESWIGLALAEPSWRERRAVVQIQVAADHTIDHGGANTKYVGVAGFTQAGAPGTF